MGMFLATILVIVGISLGIGLVYLGHKCPKPKHLFQPKGKNNPFGYLMWDLNGKKAQAVNLHEILNIVTPIRSLEQLSSYFLGADQTLFLQACHDCINKQHNFSITLQISIDDDKRFVDCYAHLDYADDGHPAHITFYFWEVTHHVSQDQELAVQTNNLEQEVKQQLMLLNAATFPMWQRNSDLDITFCNMSYCQAIDFQIGNADKNEPIPELSRTGRHLAQKALTNRRICSENHHIIIDGERRLFTIIEVPSSDYSSLNGYAIDITQQEHLVNDVNRHIEAQSDFFESLTSAVAIFGSDTRIQYFNHAFIALWQLDEQWLAAKPTYNEFLGILREQRKLPEQANFLAYKEAQAKLFSELTEPHNEFYYLPSGNTLRVVAIPYAMGGLIFTYEDLTERLALERSYNTLIEVQRATLDHLQEGVAVFGSDGKLKLFNPVYAKMWNHQSEFLTTQPHINELIERAKEFYHYGEDWNLFKSHIISLVQTSEAQIVVVERTDNSVVQRLVVPLPDGGTMFSYVDITASSMLAKSLKERNEALETADQVKKEFLANISYELRTPLTSIIGFSDLLLSHSVGELKPKHQEYIGDIRFASTYLLNLIDDILDLTSIDAGHLELEVRRFDINEMLQKVIPLMKELAQQQHVVFTLNCETTGAMDADEHRLVQVLTKILYNAILYNKPGGHVSLGTRIEGSDVELWVEDSGIGIEEAELSRIFDRFYRAPNAKISGVKGTGLGLSVAKNIIDMHGGTITITSRLGQGTSVTCRIPRYRP